jgi:hypothetical protein
LGFSLYCIYEIRWKFAPNNGSKYSNVFFFFVFPFLHRVSPNIIWWTNSLFSIPPHLSKSLSLTVWTIL